MSNKQQMLGAAIFFSCVFLSSAASAFGFNPDRKISIQKRVARIEQQLSAQDQIDLLNRVEQLQQEIQLLQGKLEVQAHDVETLNGQLQKYYKDLDQRIAQKDTGTSSRAISVEFADSQSTVSPQVMEQQKVVPKPQAKAVLSDPATERREYQAAYKLLKSKKYDKAIVAMQSYTERFPQSMYSANAHYWLGELYILQGQINIAKDEFTTVVTNYPESPKVADAKLKLGFMLYDDGNYNAAYQKLSEVVKQYPESASARLAAARLQSINLQSKR